MRPPNRTDIAARKITRECAARDHDFPDEGLRPTTTWTDADGDVHHEQRTPCAGCGTIRVMRWREPRAAVGAFMAMSTNEWPEPGDVPGIDAIAAALTDEEIVQAGGLPFPVVEVVPETLRPAVRVKARQFYLLDGRTDPSEIIPVPRGATGAILMHAVPGAAVFWTESNADALDLTVVVSPTDPGAELDGYDDVVEATFEAGTGELRLDAIGSERHPFRPLSIRDYRVRYHVRNGAYLLQIWPWARSAPRVLKLTSAWAVGRRVTSP
ncbi:hypothetical protein [Spirillospora sp. CA-294931]|uniref:hypothetical protein n=1 Tax=Spirillospora sp. CA-294931 TaxID=3240042 RepID=UPI003D8E3034